MSFEGYAGQVLIVEDDPFMGELLQAELEEAGFRVTLARDLATLRQSLLQRTYDFALMDLFLENESSLEAIPLLVRESPYTKIIIMSAHGTLELAVDAMEKGASSFISKGKDPKELIAALKQKMGHVPKGAISSAVSVDSYGIIGDSPAIYDVLARINQVKDIDSTVLITGESGTGKELVARAIHSASHRSGERFEAINCGAIPENLLESELFGHKRGAFTDAKTDRRGLFELCQNGTLFLDEIGELPLNLQVKLLRVLQERQVMPLGGQESISINTRVIVATNRVLPTEVKKGTFRTDLYYRLNVIQIQLPALRERKMDIPALIEFFLKRFNQRFSKTILPPSRELEARLVAHGWPGNIRELQNALERGVVLATDGTLRLENMLDQEIPESEAAVGLSASPDALWSSPLSEAKKNFERTYLQQLLEVTKGNISEIARISGRYRADIYRLMTKYGVQWDEFREGP